MKAIIRFNLDDPEDRREFKLAQQAGAWQSVVWELDQWLRKNTKYDEDIFETKDPENSATPAEIIRRKLHELMEESEVSFD